MEIDTYMSHQMLNVYKNVEITKPLKYNTRKEMEIMKPVKMSAFKKLESFKDEFTRMLRKYLET